MLLETNGTLNIDLADNRCVRIMDIKCPSSSEAEKNRQENLEILTEKDELKLVIGDFIDYEFAKEMISKIPPKLSGILKIHFSPLFGRMEPKTLGQWLLKDNLNVRLHLQLHKYIWNPDLKGV